MKNILVIDDDQSIQALYKRFLEKHGYAVVLASNGKEGLARLAERTPDLVITDIMMPETDGLEVIMAMKHNEKQVPVIAISGGMRSAPMDFLPMASKFGASKVLYKPVDLEDLLGVVKETLEG